MENLDVSQLVLRPEDAPEVAGFIAELALPFLNVDPDLRGQADRLAVLGDACSIAWNVSRLERRAEGADLARRHYAEIVADNPRLKSVLDRLLKQARSMDWYACADVKILLEGDRVVISAVQHDAFSGLRAPDGQIAH